jgi:transposase
MTVQQQRDISRKLRVLNHAKQSGNISATCLYFGISREAYYQWQRAYAAKGEAGLINSKPCPENPKLRTPKETEEKILHLRRTYHLGPLHIAWYLKRYHDITISGGGVRNVLLRHGLKRLPRNAKKHTVLTQRYEKQVPGHPVQVDVKFLDFKDQQKQKVRRSHMWAMATPTLELVPFYQPAHCRCAHHDAALLSDPIAELLESTI